MWVNVIIASSTINTFLAQTNVHAYDIPKKTTKICEMIAAKKIETISLERRKTFAGFRQHDIITTNNSTHEKMLL